jgi:hypothetical protein
MDANGMDLLERKNMGGDETDLSGEIPNARWDKACGRPALKWNYIENTTKRQIVLSRKRDSFFV